MVGWLEVGTPLGSDCVGSPVGSAWSNGVFDGPVVVGIVDGTGNVGWDVGKYDGNDNVGSPVGGGVGGSLSRLSHIVKSTIQCLWNQNVFLNINVCYRTSEMKSEPPLWVDGGGTPTHFEGKTLNILKVWSSKCGMYLSTPAIMERSNFIYWISINNFWNTLDFVLSCTKTHVFYPSTTPQKNIWLSDQKYENDNIVLSIDSMYFSYSVRDIPQILLPLGILVCKKLVIKNWCFFWKTLC